MADHKDVVILAVDDSPHAEAAFEFYAGNIHGPGKILVMVHCQEISNLHHQEGSHLHHKESGSHQPHYDKWIKLQREQEQAVEQLQQKYQQKLAQKQIEGEWMVAPSNKPGETLISEANKRQATMIVTGTRGQGALRRTILGSVSDYLLHHAACPVIITRQ